MKFHISYIILCSIVVFFPSCEQPPVQSQQELIDIYIEERLVESKENFWKNCYTDIVKDAEAYVDSIIFREVNFNVGDTVQTPGKPFKPKRPFDTLKLDSTPVNPIILDTLEQ